MRDRSKRDSSTARADNFAERSWGKKRRPAPVGMTVGCLSDNRVRREKAVESHACKRLRQWLCAKHKVMSGTKRFSEASLYAVLGIVRLTKRTRYFSRGRPHDPFSESRKREIRISVSMSGV